MVTVIVRFRFPDGLDEAGMRADVFRTGAVFDAQAALIRRQISIDFAARTGVSIHLWRDRASAELFYDVALDLLREHTGHPATVEILDTQFVVDQQPVAAPALAA